VRVARIISRLNIGGPAIQVITLTKELEAFGYDTTLIRGREGPDEGSMDYLAQGLGVETLCVPWLRRDIGLHDLRALLALVIALRRERPQIVHTHAAKAGTLGRLAALLAFRRRERPLLVHTFHGHSLTSYFSSRWNAVFLQLERYLARHTHQLIAVSTEVRDELEALGVAPLERFAVVPVGFDLSAFTVDDRERAQRRAAFRADVGIPQCARVVTLVARLVPIKRVDRFLRIANRLQEEPDLYFMVVGDGQLRDQLQATPEARSLTDRILWTGFRRDMPDVCFASDVVVLTSDNEGTPVSLIEAQAAAVPVVTTDVGGVSSVVLNRESGWLVARNDESGLVQRVRELLADAELANQMGKRGREHAIAGFTLDRLTADVASLCRRLLHESRPV
jgi:glycosyltransferase involved in cell wall biosynthesis